MLAQDAIMYMYMYMEFACFFVSVGLIPFCSIKQILYVTYLSLICVYVCVGWLIKEGRVRRKRFFILTESLQLRYYKSEDTRQPVTGCIHLNWYAYNNIAPFHLCVYTCTWIYEVEIMCFKFFAISINKKKV